MNHCVNPVAIPSGGGQGFEHHETAALAGYEAFSAAVINRHITVGECTGFGKTDQLKRVQADVHTTHDSQVQILIHHSRCGMGHGQQRRRAGPVDSEAPAHQVEMIADATGNGIGKPTG